MNVDPSSAPGDLERLAKLRDWFKNAGSVLVCFSGGVDSALLAALAVEQLGSQAVALTATGPSLPESDRTQAKELAASIGIIHHLVETDELDRPEYVRNHPDRCYHCKSVLFALAEAKRQEWGLRRIVVGANLDDLADFRPGHEAARQAGVQAPLLELGLTKAEVRRLARILGLSVWDRPAAACLASRIPYGTPITAERLRQVGGLEAELRNLGFRQVRARWHERLVRLELGEDELERAAESPLRQQIVAAGRRHGFHHVTLDLAGYRPGSQNELLESRNRGR